MADDKVGAWAKKINRANILEQIIKFALFIFFVHA